MWVEFGGDLAGFGGASILGGHRLCCHNLCKMGKLRVSLTSPLCPELAATSSRAKQGTAPDAYACCDGNKVIKHYIVRDAVPLLGFPLCAESWQ